MCPKPASLAPPPPHALAKARSPSPCVSNAAKWHAVQLAFAYGIKQAEMHANVTSGGLCMLAASASCRHHSSSHVLLIGYLLLPVVCVSQRHMLQQCTNKCAMVRWGHASACAAAVQCKISPKSVRTVNANAPLPHAHIYVCVTPTTHTTQESPSNSMRITHQILGKYHTARQPSRKKMQQHAQDTSCH